MIVSRKIYMLHEVERAEKRKELRSKCVRVIVNVNIEIASDDELMRCSSSDRQERGKFFKKNRKRLREGGRQRTAINIKDRQFSTR